MRLKDADALMESLRKEKRWIVKRDGYTNEGYSYDQVMFSLDNAPTIDAVPVVRCKDCKHWSDARSLLAIAGCTGNVGCCKLANWMIGANGYCLYGERKEV